MPEIVNNKTIFSLLEVTRSIQKTLAERYKSLYWIKAEMNKLNFYTHSGHCYPELVEKKDGKIVAEIRSVLWNADYNRINNQFIKIAQTPLREGITMLFQASISYDPLYGLSLKIVDIDPVFTLGELEREKLESINTLKAEGLFEKNKQLPFPLIPKRLAIISVETSKGLSDFYKIIHHNAWGYHFETTLFPALLQGDKSVQSIIRQLQNIAEKTAHFDVVAIIRGGGGEVGLSSYNNYLLAKAIAIFPLPVVTGIGHSTNLTVSEMVAYKNAITPSELADFLIQKFHDFAIPLEQATENLLSFSRTRFKEAQLLLMETAQKIRWSTNQFLQNEKAHLKNQEWKLQHQSTLLLTNEKRTLTHLERLIHLADPVRLLQRGFSITKQHGKTIISGTDIQEGETIETVFFDGIIESNVTKKILTHGK